MSPIVGLDCERCCLAAYDSIYKLQGAEVATASFKKGPETALIDPEKTDRSQLENALIRRVVVVKPAE